MYQFMRIVLVLLMLASVRGRDLACDQLVVVEYCWDPQTQTERNCSVCNILEKYILDGDNVTFSGQHRNGSHAAIELVIFNEPTINTLPRVFDKLTNQEIGLVLIYNANITVLNAKFFAPESGKILEILGIRDTRNTSEMLFESLAFRDCANLEILLIQKIASIPIDAFVGLRKLFILDLNSNKLKTIPENAFNPLVMLKRLNLNDNKITSISRSLFAKNKQLQSIDLSNNEIKEIQIGTFQHLWQLRELKLNANKCINREFKTNVRQVIAEGLTPCYP